MREDGFPRRRTNLKRARGPNQLASYPLSPALALAPVMPDVATMSSPVTQTENIPPVRSLRYSVTFRTLRA